jgi:hypothetical protein
MNMTFSPQGLIDEVNNHDYPNSFAILAHPYGSPKWPDWSVSRFRGMELMSNEHTAKAKTINKWFEQLRNGMADTFEGKGFVVGLANTDAHNSMDPGDAGFTWLHIGNYSNSNRGAVWNAIKKGRASASGMKDLGVFSINGALQGSVVKVVESGTLDFKLIQQPVSGRKCTEITIRDKDNKVVKRIKNPKTKVTSVSLPVETEATFYVVKYIFCSKSGKDYSHVWANPIFVGVSTLINV